MIETKLKVEKEEADEPIKLDNEKWKCPYCAYSTNRRRDVDRHIKSQHLSNR